MSQIYTAELHHVEPFDYLVALLRHEAAVALDPAAWMPWNYAATLARLAAEPTDSAPTDSGPVQRRPPSRRPPATLQRPGHHRRGVPSAR